MSDQPVTATTSTRESLGWGLCCVAIPLCFFGGLGMVPWMVFLSGILGVIGGVLMGVFRRGAKNGSYEGSHG